MLSTNNLIKIRSQHLLPIFYQLFTSRSMGDLQSFFRGHVGGQHEYIRCLVECVPKRICSSCLLDFVEE